MNEINAVFCISAVTFSDSMIQHMWKMINTIQYQLKCCNKTDTICKCVVAIKSHNNFHFKLCNNETVNCNRCQSKFKMYVMIYENAGLST